MHRVATKPLVMAWVFLMAWGAAAQARQIIDMSGRQVTVPATIGKVYGTSPPTTYMIYAMDPGLVAGLNVPLTATEKRYFARLETLPVIGGWFGQGRTCNRETLMAVHPDVILVWWWRGDASCDKIEQALKPLDIPFVYIVLDDLEGYAEAFAFLGRLLDRPERAATLGRYAAQTLDAAARVRTAIADDERTAVYYAEDGDGLSTECNDSVHAQLIPLSGGRNVHRCIQRVRSGRQKVSMEQVLAYDPQVIVSHNALFLDRLAGDARWRNIRAVRDGRVYRIPVEPFNWFDRPPSFMRLLGLHWMMHRLYPALYPIDIEAETLRFCRLFLDVDLDGAALRALLAP